jgi:hypothetical protein
MIARVPILHGGTPKPPRDSSADAPAHTQTPA